MILITLDGGLVQGIFSNERALVGRKVIVNDLDDSCVDDDTHVLNYENQPCCPQEMTVELLHRGELLKEKELLRQRRVLMAQEAPDES